MLQQRLTMKAWWLLLASLALSGASPTSALPSTSVTSSLTLNGAPHLFVDIAGLSETTGLAIVQHSPEKTGEMAVVVDRS